MGKGRRGKRFPIRAYRVLCGRKMHENFYCSCSRFGLEVRKSKPYTSADKKLATLQQGKATAKGMESICRMEDQI